MRLTNDRTAKTLYRLIFRFDLAIKMAEFIVTCKNILPMKNFKDVLISNAGTSSPQVKPLFRQQAIEFTNTKQYGTVILASYISYRILTAFFCTIAVTIIAFFIFFTTVRKTDVPGVLLPSEGLIRVRPGQMGVVTQVRVKEGQNVKAGDVLFVLSNERNIGSVRSAEGTVSALLQNRRESYRDELLQASQQSKQRVLAAQKRATALLEEGARLDSQIVLQRSRVALATQAFQRFKELHKTNYISAAQLEEKEGELLDQRQRLAELERLKGINGRDYASAEADYHDLRYQTQRDEAALKRNELTTQQDLAESEARREIQVIAPTAGTVTAITVEVGKPVLADSTLAAILPAGSELEAEIYAPSRAVGFIKPGMKVLLRYQAYPYQKFGQYEAIVHEVAGASMSPQEQALPGAAVVPNQASEPVYRIRLKLKQQSILAYGESVSLKPGMVLDASIILEHRRLYEWILEPLFSISGRG
jgi:membrane fusion protein